jgi:hypothetical protein
MPCRSDSSNMHSVNGGGTSAMGPAG